MRDKKSKIDFKESESRNHEQDVHEREIDEDREKIPVDNRPHVK